MKKDVLKFLLESNAIEDVFTGSALITSYEAWDYALNGPGEKFTLSWLLEIHRILYAEFDSVLKPRIAGKLRDYDVLVGGRHCKFVHEIKLEEDLTWILTCMDTPPKNENVEDYARWCHVEFEKIHPFGDGNGRTGRILYNVQRLALGLPVHVIEAAKRQAYYSWFK